jgi:tetratricopeptide (TPR) repeat protein
MRIARVAVAAALILLTRPVLLAAGSKRKHTPAKRSASAKRDTSREEQRLRARLEFAPNDHDAYKQLLKLLKDRYAFRAQALLDAQWLQNNPDDYFALIDLTSCATAVLDDPEFAIAAQRTYLSKVQRDPSDTTYDFTMSSLASALSRRGRSDGALRLSDQLLEWTPDDAGLWADRAAIQFRMGRIADALISMRQSVKLDSGSESTHEELADLLFVSGNIDDALTEYRAALSVYKAKYDSGETNGSFSDLIGSMVRVERKYQSEHSLAQMQLKYARALMQAAKYDDAITATRAALAADKNAIVAFYVRARVYEAAGDAVNSEKTRAAVMPAITNLVSKTEMSRTKDFGDPRVAFLTKGDTASEFAPLTLAAELIALLEHRTERLTTFEKLALADALIATGATDRGRVLWESVLAEGTKHDTAQAHAALARALLKATDVEHALPHLRRAYELDPVNVTYRTDYETYKPK